MRFVFWVVALCVLKGNLFGQGCCENFASPCAPCAMFQVGGDWLYWKAEQDDLEYAINVRAATDGTATRINSTVLRPGFKPRNGYRIFASYSPCCDWEIGAIFTHFSSHAKSASSVNPGTLSSNFIIINNQRFPIFNALNGAANGAAFSSINSNWGFKLNYLDLDLCRNIPLFQCLQINPHLGLRGLATRQDFRVNGLVPLSDGVNIVTADLRDKLCGIGVEGGLAATFNVGCGFSVIGQFGGSLLYARTRTSERLEVHDGSSITINVMPVQVRHAAPTLDSFIGAQFENRCGRFPINVHVGWEQHIIFNANHFAIFDFADLTLQGLVLGGSVSF